MTTIQGKTPPTKENSAWDALCDLTTELFPQFGSRLAAFKEACARRPDLAATAIDPVGSPVIQGAVTPVASSSQGTRPVAAVDAPSRSALVRACEARAAS